jgi:hypothetical protein
VTRRGGHWVRIIVRAFLISEPACSTTLRRGASKPRDVGGACGGVAAERPDGQGVRAEARRERGLAEVVELAAEVGSG